MTHSKGLYHRPTDSLIQRTPGATTFYPVDIPVPHSQLRNFISTVDKDWLYYASGYNIYTFHIPTKRTSLLITVPFAPRCLTAGIGWICLGGDSHGDCAFIRLNKQTEDTGLEVDTRLPIDLPGELSSSKKDEREDVQSQAPLALNAHAPNKTFPWQPDLLTHEFGGDIVNSITVHEIANSGRSEWNEPVALLSNNDKTVKIYSLVQRKVVAELLHPFPMNYALLSPNSNILVTVGDGARAFFYRRKPAKRQPSGQSRDDRSTRESTVIRFPKYDWQLFAIPKLPIGDRMNDDHSFAVTFSPSGHLCAISSQGGMISVFDMETLSNLEDEEESDKAFLCTFRSSRAPIWGCVRAMEFSPEPWDLLAWSEDHGRIGVADVRQAFCRRQLIDLDAQEVQTVELEDCTPLSIKNLDTKGRLMHQYRERMQAECGRPISQAEDLLLRNFQPTTSARSVQPTAADLSERERSVLDSLEMTMDELYEASQPQQPHPYSLNYTSSPRVRASLESERAATGVSDQTGEQRERLRSIARSYLPRRRNSVVLSRQATLAPPRATSRNRLTESPSQLSQPDDHEAEIEDDGDDTDAELPPLMSTNDLTPTAGGSQSQPLPYNIPPSDPWHVIQSALESARSSDARPSDVSETGATGTTTAPSQRDTTHRLTLGNPAGTQSTVIPTAIRPIDPDVRRYMDEALLQARETLHIDRRTNAARYTLGDSSRDIERHQRILEARAQARQRVAAANAGAGSSGSGRPSRTERRTELGRPSDSDMRLARLMMISSSRQATDQNGNWVAGQALERLVAARSAGADADGLGGGAARQMALEMGLGTTGVAWSPDGRHL